MQHLEQLRMLNQQQLSLRQLRRLEQNQLLLERLQACTLHAAAVDPDLHKYTEKESISFKHR